MDVPDPERRYRVHPGSFRPADHHPADTARLDREHAGALRRAGVECLRSLPPRLYAGQQRSLLDED